MSLLIDNCPVQFDSRTNPKIIVAVAPWEDQFVCHSYNSEIQDFSNGIYGSLAQITPLLIERLWSHGYSQEEVVGVLLATILAR